jgi:2-polyprenyl-3-methyl-5-hydroxy-6-metoxy-1,4-benzoquinol methylase
MQNKNNSLDDRPVVIKNYITGNFVVRFLLNRLLRKISKTLIKLDGFRRIGLDVGCGSGNMISYLHNRNAIGRLVAVDLDKDRLTFAKRQFPVCHYLNMDVNALAFKQGAFEYILAAEILEHLPDPDQVIKEMRRAAKNDAYLILSVPHEPFFCWGNLLRGKYWSRGGRTPTHVNFWTLSEFKHFLSRFFDIEAQYAWSVFPWMLFLVRFK